MQAKRLLLLAGLALVGVLATALPASACSCMYADPRDQFNDADAAIVGEFVGRRPTDDEFRAIYTFRVEDEWKARFGDTLDVFSADNGAACGLEAQVGQSVGLFLTMDGSEWSSSLCSQTSPEVMREAASPLPAPDGSGPARLMVGGSFGEARVMTLDANGNTLAYGYGGDHDTVNLDGCPGGSHVVEVYEKKDDQGAERWFAVRRLSDMGIVREVPLDIEQFEYVTSLDCRDADATKTFMFVTPTYGRPDGTILAETSDGIERRFEGLVARQAEFGRKHVYLSGARGRVTAMRLDGESSRVLYSVKGTRPFSRAVLSEDGRHLALVAFATYEPQRDAKLVLIDVRDGSVRQRKGAGDLGYDGVLAWVGSRRLVFVAGQGSPVYNLHLKKVGGLGPAFATDVAVSGDELWGVSFGELMRAGLPNDRIAHDRYLPSPVTHTLISLPL